MKLQDLQERVRARHANEQPNLAIVLSATDAVDVIVRATVEGLGFHVSAAGDICDPRPTPASAQPQNGVRWSGGRGRRRGGRR
jgi:hypothetical protein